MRAYDGAYYLAPDVKWILFFCVLHGLGFGLATTFFATMATESMPKERRGEGMGYFGVGEMVAISIGPLIGTAILLHYDFHGLFAGGMALLFLASAALYGFGCAIFPALQTWCVNPVEEHEHEHAMASFFNFFDLGIGAAP